MDEPEAAVATETMTLAEAINRAIAEGMERGDVIHLGQDIGVYGGTFGVTKGLFERFGGELVRDGPLSESATVGFGIGLAMMGWHAIAEIEFIDFTALAMDQIVNQAAKMHYFSGGKLTVPLTIRTPIVARMGMGPQHSQSLEAWYVHAPGLRVAIPSAPADALGLMRTALEMPDPVLFIENARLYSRKGDVPSDPDFRVPFGSAAVVREGTDITVVAVSGMIPEAVAVGDDLEDEGISVEVIDPRTLAPLDIGAIVASVQKTHRLVITHDAYKTGGVGAEIGQSVQEAAFDYLDAPISRVAAEDVPVPSGPSLDMVYPTRERVASAIRDLVGRGR